MKNSEVVTEQAQDGLHSWGPSSIDHYCQIVALIDLACLVLAGWLWSQQPGVAIHFTAHEATLITMGLVLLTAYACRQFAPIRLGRLIEIPWPVTDPISAVIAAGAVGWLLTYLLVGSQAAWLVLLWPVAALSLLLPDRILMSGCTRLLVRAGWLHRNVAIVGTTDMAAELLSRLQDRQHSEPTHVVGIFDDRDATRRPPSLEGVAVRGNVASLCEVAMRERIDLIVIALPFSRAIDIMEALQHVRELGSDVVVQLDDARQTPRVFSHLAVAGLPVLLLLRTPLRPSAMLLKRLIDIILASFALIITAPILLGACLALWLEGAGPIFFRQTRLGLHGRKFDIMKLRTMRDHVDDPGNQGVRDDDPRITRLGRFLRATCIDELPQTINVLRGEMSMVGPRPHVANMLVGGEPIQELAPGYAARFRMKPGVTGWAQVNSLSGSITSAAMAREVTEHDLTYISDWSIPFDLRILARTAAIFVFGRKAFVAKPHEWRGV